MTDSQRNAALSAKIREHAQRDTRSKAAAMGALMRKGFYLSNGEPAPEFAPETAPKRAAV